MTATTSDHAERAIVGMLLLDPTNLVTLCRRLTGGHHLAFGHLGDWTLENPCVIEAAAVNRAG